MREMWDYESQEPFSGRTRNVSKIAPEKSKSLHAKLKTSVNYVLEIIRLNNVLMKESLVWEWIPLALTQKINSLMVRVKV